MVKKLERLKHITWSERITYVMMYGLLAFILIVILIPIFNVIATSFISGAERARRSGFVFIPEEWDLTAYIIMLGPGSNLWSGFKNTLFVVVVGTFLNMLFTIPMAYGLSHKNW